jgi:P4 family phage/plasmid primase-like protien
MEIQTQELIKNFIDESIKEKNSLNGLDCVETYTNETITNIKKLLKSDLLINENYNFKGETQEYNEKKILQNILDNVKNNSLKVKYSRKKPQGRISTFGGLSRLRREVRNTLAFNDYVDIDAVNCCYSIINTLMHYYELDSTNISYYLENREKILKHVQKNNKISRDVAKNLFIVIGFCGSVERWKKDNNIKELDENTYILVEKIKEEIYILNKTIVEKETEFMNLLDKDNKEYTTICKFVFNLESKILEFAYKFLKNKKVIKNNCCVLIYDGLMIFIQKDKFKESILKELSKELKEKTGFKMKFIVKNYDDHFLDEIEDIEFDEEEKEELENFEFWTEKRAADVFRKLNNDYIYSGSTDIWYAYNENNILTQYKKEPLGISNKITEILQEYIEAEYSKYPEEKKKSIKRFYKSAINICGTNKFTSACCKFLKKLYSNEKINDLLNANNDLFAFDNCVYDYSIKECRPIKRSDYISITTGYNLNLESNKEIRDFLNKFFLSLFRTKEETEYLLRTIAFSLRYNHLQTLNIWTGSGGNGKSLLNNLMNKIFGKYFQNTESTFLTKNTDTINTTLYDARRKKIVLTSEPINSTAFEKDTYLNQEFIKKITGGDPIVTRTIFKDNIEYRATFSTFLLCNDKPKLPKIDEAIARRLRILDFPFKFVQNPESEDEKKVDFSLSKKFNEDQRYSNEFMLMLIEILNNTDINNDILPESVKKSISEYLDENNPIKSFIEKNYILTSNNKDRIHSKDLYNEFIDLTNNKMTINKFASCIELLKIKKIKSCGYNYYTNLKKREPEIKEEN